MEIRVLTEADAGIFWAVRLRALREEPEAFGRDYEETKDRPLAEVAGVLREEAASADDFTLGAFEGVAGAEALIGIAGFRRHRGRKERHKGDIWGMYVAPEGRGRGVGRALLEELVGRARALPDLEQIHLAVVATNVAAGHLYRALGFARYGTEPRALRLGDRYLDEELMVLRLEELEAVRAYEAAQVAGDEAVPFGQAVAEIGRDRPRQ